MNNNSTGTASGQLEIVQVDGEPFAERQPRMPKDGQPRAYRCSPARETARPTPCVRPGAIQQPPDGRSHSRASGSTQPENRGT